MGSYISGTLLPGEKIIYEAKTSYAASLFTIIVGIALLAAFGLGLLILLYVYLERRSTELAVTDKRIVAKFGLISRSTVEINLANIQSVQIEQSIMGRILNYGSILVSGTGLAQAPIPEISNPMMFRNQVMALVSK